MEVFLRTNIREESSLVNSAFDKALSTIPNSTPFSYLEKKEIKEVALGILKEKK